MKYILFLVMLLAIPGVFAADSCHVNNICTWYAVGNAATQNVSLTIIDSDGTQLYTDENMTLLTGNIYKFDSNITQTGQVVATSSFYNSTGLQGTSDESKNIYEDEANINLTMIAQVLQPFLIFIIGAVLLLLGLATKERDGYVYNIFAGIWWLGSAAFMFYTGTMITSIFFVMLGVVTVFFGISKLGEE